MASFRPAAVASGLVLLASSLSTAADPAAWMVLSSDRPRVGQPYSLVLAAGVDARSNDVRVVVRHRGNQELIEPQQEAGAKRQVWRFTPRTAGAYIVATTVEPSRAAIGEGVHRYEKLIVRVASADPTKTTAALPSASTTARFAHRLELAPLVDPTCLRVGADFPLRIKLDGVNLEGASVHLAVTPPIDPAAVPKAARGNKADPASVPALPNDKAGAAGVRTMSGDADKPIRSGASGFLNVPVRRAGRWVLSVQHEQTIVGPDGAAVVERFIATLTFDVQAGPAAVGKGAPQRGDENPPKRRGLD